MQVGGVRDKVGGILAVLVVEIDRGVSACQNQVQCKAAVRIRRFIIKIFYDIAAYLCQAAGRGGGVPVGGFVVLGADGQGFGKLDVGQQPGIVKGAQGTASTVQRGVIDGGLRPGGSLPLL